MDTTKYYLIDRSENNMTGCNSKVLDALEDGYAIKCKCFNDGELVGKFFITDYNELSGVYTDIDGNQYDKVIVIKKKTPKVFVKTAVEIITWLTENGYTPDVHGNWCKPYELTWNSAMFRYCGGEFSEDVKSSHRWLDAWLVK